MASKMPGIQVPPIEAVAGSGKRVSPDRAEGAKEKVKVVHELLVAAQEEGE